MAAESKVTAVVPLNGSNYATWKVQCKMALMRNGLWSIITKEETAPVDIKSREYASFMTKYHCLQFTLNSERPWFRRIT